MTTVYQTACQTFTQTYKLAILLGKLRLTLLFGVVQLRVVLRYCVCVTDVTAKNINSYVYTRAYARARHTKRGNEEQMKVLQKRVLQHLLLIKNKESESLSCWLMEMEDSQKSI